MTLKVKGLGTRLREWRKAVPLKSFQLAKKIKISQGSLSDIENNKSLPSADTIFKLWELTDINIGWLLSGRKDMRPIDEGVTKAEEHPPLSIVLNSFEKKVLISYDINS